MTMNALEKIEFLRLVREILWQTQVQDMRNYVQHGNTSTLAHCYSVAYYSYYFAYLLPMRFDKRSIVRGAMLHDFYLYDWHIPDRSHRLHGFVHPRFALSNAKRHFQLNLVEEDIILKHMWPLTLNMMPRCREAFLVCIIDKYCSLAETLYIPIVPKKLLPRLRRI